MLPTNRTATHPGELVRENLQELGVSQVDAAKHCHMSLQRLNEIINGKRGITADTALVFGQAFGTTPEFWMNAQAAHDLSRARAEKKKIPQLKRRAA